MTSIGDKAACMTSRPDDGRRFCHWTGCYEQVPAAMRFCGPHSQAWIERHREAGRGGADEGGAVAEGEAAASLQGLLSDVGAAVLGRLDTYGDPAPFCESVALLWRRRLGRPIGAADVAGCMADLKRARLAAAPGHRDSAIDLLGWTLLEAHLTLLAGNQDGAAAS